MSGAAGRFFDLSAERLALLRERRPAPAAAPVGDDLAPVGDDLAPRRDAGPPPLSFAQERLWFLDRLDPGTSALNVTAGLALRGRLDRGALAAALAATVRRHEVLRWRFATVGGRPEVRVAPPGPVPLPVVDLAALPEVRRTATAARLAEVHAHRGFDLAAGPLLRAVLLDLGGGEHRLHLAVHHVVSDGWSFGVLFAEVAAVYADLAAGRPPRLAPLPIQYGDWAAWQRRWLSGGRLAAEVTSKQPEGLVGKQILVQTDGSNGLTKYNVKRADIQHLRKGRAVQVVLSLPARNCLAAFKTVMPAS